MAKFIEVTNPANGCKYLINIEDICRVEDCAITYKVETYIYTKHEGKFEVKETYKEIKAMLEVVND